MVPRLGSRQFIKRVLEKDKVEVVEVPWDVFLMIHWLEVLSEIFCKSLRNSSRCLNVLCLGKKPSCPYPMTFLKWFIGKIIGFHIRKAFGLGLGFILPIGIFNQGWERTCLTNVYLCIVFPFCIPLCLAFGLTANAAEKASGHFDTSDAEVNLWIMLVQPGEPEYHTLFTKSGDSKQDAFGELVVGYDHINNLVNTSSLIQSSI